MILSAIVRPFKILCLPVIRYFNLSPAIPLHLANPSVLFEGVFVAVAHVHVFRITEAAKYILSGGTWEKTDINFFLFY